MSFANKIKRRFRSLSAGRAEESKSERKDWDEWQRWRSDKEYEEDSEGDFLTEDEEEEREFNDVMGSEKNKKEKEKREKGQLKQVEGIKESKNKSTDEIYQIMLDRMDTNDEIIKESIKKLKGLQTGLEKLQKEQTDPEDPHGDFTSLIKPPQLEDNSERCNSEEVRRSATYERMFKSIPVFNGEGEDIRAFLMNLNSIANSSNLKISKGCFRSILLSKLTFRVRMTINGGSVENNKTLEEIYRSLQDLYDFSESEDEAIHKIHQLSRNEEITTMDLFNKEITRLLSLTNQSVKEKARLYGIAIKMMLPKRIREFFQSFVQNFRKRKDSDGYPEINKMINFLRPYREECDEAFKQHSKSFKNTRVREVTTGDNRKNLLCNYCNKPGHKAEQCYTKRNKERKERISMCTKCGRGGHIAEKCRVRCRMCNSLQHTAERCDIYEGKMITQDKCEYCSKKINVNLYHPQEKCILKSK